jgi:UDP-hydrolysing UDP-N-acetyl-D-glucosamine 2-epimerase
MALLRPTDIVLLLGDRYETMLAATVATYKGLAIAHVHGGEASYGSMDNQYRDAITKLSHIHFVAHSQAAARLRDLGESSNRIHVVGAPGLDAIRKYKNVFKKNNKKIVVTYHPETLGEGPYGADAVAYACSYLQNIGFEIVWTGVNNDPGYNYVQNAFSKRGFEEARLSHHDYLQLLAESTYCLGNSSSGIIEAPTLKTITINVGDRQKGRLCSDSVFHAKNDVISILSTFLDAGRYSGRFNNPYEGNKTSQRIAETLIMEDIDKVKTW